MKNGLLAIVCLAAIGCTLLFHDARASEVAQTVTDAPKAELIGEGVVSTPDDEFGGALSPDGTVLYYDITVPAHYLYVMCESHLRDGKWQKPEVLPFSGLYRDSDPVLTPDGKTLLFASAGHAMGLRVMTSSSGQRTKPLMAGRNHVRLMGR